MAIKKYTATEGVKSSENNHNEEVLFKGTALNHIRQLIDRAGVYSADGKDLWGEAYVDATGRNNSVDTGNTTALFDTDKYKPFNEAVYMIIEATSLTISDFAINNCICRKIENGKWLLYCTTGTDEVKRAQIYATLFYGPPIPDFNDTPAPKVLNITGLTALRSSRAADDGKRVHLATSYVTSPSSDPEATYTGTFAITTDNLVDSWSYLNRVNNPWAYWEMPSGTILHSGPEGGSDETGTDTSSDQTTNPSDCVVNLRGSSNTTGGSAAGRVLILTKGQISWVAAGDTGDQTASNIDFTADNSVPVFSSITEFPSLITHDIPTGTFPATISSAYGKGLFEDWETGATIQYKLTNTGGDDSGWLTENEKESFTAFTTGEPDTLIVKLIPKTTSPTAGYPSLKGFSLITE